jgi:hypothetical protein
MIVITITRRPIEGTVAANVLKWGTGGMNIEASRVGDQAFGPTTYKPKGGGTEGKVYGVFAGGEYAGHVGRWPSNVILLHLPGCHGAECAEGCPVAALDHTSVGNVSRFFKVVEP